MISGILFLNQKGEVLLSRMYRDGVTRQVAETFRNQARRASARWRAVRRRRCSRARAQRDASRLEPSLRACALGVQVIVQKEAGRCPVQMFGTSSFMYVKVGSVFIVAVSQGNAQAAVAFQFLSSLVKIIKAYCGSDVNDNLIRNNFVLLYEVLDEVLDYGFPQNTTIDLLKNFITQQAESPSGDVMEMTPTANITIQATGAISWRKEGIKYRKNELFIDVVEHCNLMVSNKGTVLRNDVVGSILVKCYLSGMPECKFGLNDKLLLDNEAKNNRNKVRVSHAPSARTSSARTRAPDAARGARLRGAERRERSSAACRRGRVLFPPCVSCAPSPFSRVLRELRHGGQARASRSTTARSTSASSWANSTRTGPSRLCRPTASSS